MTTGTHNQRSDEQESSGPEGQRRSALLVVGCGSTATVAPTPVRVVQPTVETPEEPAEETGQTLHPLSVWANGFRDEVLGVIAGHPAKESRRHARIACG